MGEELLQTIPQQLGRYTYLRLGATTLDQLKNSGIIPLRDYGALATKKPDGLVLLQGGVRAVVEYKQPGELGTATAVGKAIDQEIEVARALCDLLIVTDGSRTHWVNAHSREPITDAQGNAVGTVFHPFGGANTVAIEHLLDTICSSISPTNSSIQEARLIDPTPLATRLWQTIWVATGKSPVKCLYNVIELFIFKFLSDLNILDEFRDFDHVYLLSKRDAADGLDYYAKNTRPSILKLFPKGKDGTTIIDGTIFVNENGEPNLSQSILFLRSLEHLQKYTEEFGGLTKIDKQFKTRLYESFLKQEVEALGQHFTPRRIVQSVIRMAGLDAPSYPFAGKRLCDPFCGVGGFLLEILNLNEAMRDAYAPGADGKIRPPFAMFGYDKGFERDDERTIILAKANMLIYLAELLFHNPTCSEAFAGVFNDTFTLFKNNLGTFGEVITSEDERFDLVLSNPPYVTSGSSIIKEEIRKTPKTANQFPINALGLEGLAVEWIIKSLKRHGRAFLIIPDGLLGRVGGDKLRAHILRECRLDAIVSLPVRTFFANAEHTYILAITKKGSPDEVQTEPVYTFLVSNIGERLTSVKREDIEANDLPDMEYHFKLFMADRQAALSNQAIFPPRCKIQPVERFRSSSHWVIDRWWTKDERIAIGIDGTPGTAQHADVDGLLKELATAVSEYEEFVSAGPPRAEHYVTVSLGDTSRFRLFIGKRKLKGELNLADAAVPAYSANVHIPVGYIEASNIAEFKHHFILWGIDGNFEFSAMPPGVVFATTDHCGAAEIIDKNIVAEYLRWALERRRHEESFDRSFRASLANMRQYEFEVPALADGSLDVGTQEAVADYAAGIRYRQTRITEMRAQLERLLGQYLHLD